MSDLRAILHMLSPTAHVSPFDVNMAVDAGFDVVAPYSGVDAGQVRGLVQDAIFSRGPKGVRRTGVFIGGKDALLALDMLKTAKDAMVGPFSVSCFADPAGGFTTAAAMVAKLEQHLGASGSALKGARVAVFGGTGVVGYSSAVIAALAGADARLIGHDGRARVARLADEAKRRFGAELGAEDGSSEARKTALLAECDAALCAGPAGVQLLSAAQLAAAPALKAAADVNAVPPAGIEGVAVDADGVALAGSGAVGIGALAVGDVKYRTQAGLFRRMIAADKPLFIDFRDAFALAREIVAK